MEDEGDVEREITSTAPYSPSSNGVAETLVNIVRNGTQAILQDLGLLQRFWGGDVHIPTEPDTNNRRT
jgi:hypothetical protein